MDYTFEGVRYRERFSSELDESGFRVGELLDVRVDRTDPTRAATPDGYATEDLLLQVPIILEVLGALVIVISLALIRTGPRRLGGLAGPVCRPGPGQVRAEPLTHGWSKGGRPRASASFDGSCQSLNEPRVVSPSASERTAAPPERNPHVRERPSQGCLLFSGLSLQA